MLSTAEYGTIDLTVTFVGLAVPVVSLELSDAMLRFGLSEDTDKKSLFKNGVMVLLGASLFVLLLSPGPSFPLLPPHCTISLDIPHIFSAPGDSARLPTS